MTDPEAVAEALAWVGRNAEAGGHDGAWGYTHVLAARVKELESRTCDRCARPRWVKQREEGWWYCDSISAIVRGKRSLINTCGAFSPKGGA